MKTKCLFSNQRFVLETILLSSQYKFRQPCSKTFTESPDELPHIVRKFRIIISKRKKCFPPKIRSGHIERHFDNPVDTFSSKGWKSHLKYAQLIKRNFYRVSVFPRIVPLDTHKAILTTLLKHFANQVENFPSLSETDADEKNFFILE